MRDDAQYLRICRQERGAEPLRAMLNLLRCRIDACRDELVRAQGIQIAKLQGAALCLEEIIREVEGDHPPPERQDGGYA